MRPHAAKPPGPGDSQGLVGASLSAETMWSAWLESTVWTAAGPGAPAGRVVADPDRGWLKPALQPHLLVPLPTRETSSLVHFWGHSYVCPNPLVAPQGRAPSQTDRVGKLGLVLQTEVGASSRSGSLLATPSAPRAHHIHLCFDGEGLSHRPQRDAPRGPPWRRRGQAKGSSSTASFKPRERDTGVSEPSRAWPACPPRVPAGASAARPCSTPGVGAWLAMGTGEEDVHSLCPPSPRHGQLWPGDSVTGTSGVQKEQAQA